MYKRQVPDLESLPPGLAILLAARVRDHETAAKTLYAALVVGVLSQRESASSLRYPAPEVEPRQAGN